MKVFLFDIGNVLCNFNIDIMLKNYQIISGKPVSIHSNDDQILYNAVENGDLSDQEYVDKVNQTKNLNWSIEDLVLAWKNIFTENFYGRKLYYHALDEQTYVCLLSNIAQYHVEAINAKWPQLLDLADYHFFSYQIGVRKPNKAIYKFVLDKLNVSPKDCFFIDDMKENILAAKELGICSYQFIPETINEVFIKANSFFKWANMCKVKS